MKHTLYYITSLVLPAALVTASLLAVSCRPEAEKATPEAAPSEPVPVAADQDAASRGTALTINDAKATDTDTDSSPACYYPRDTITGQFRPGIVDTLIAEPISEPDEEGCYWDRKIYSPGGSIADIPFGDRLCYVFYICNVGDLDGNGTDEICIYSRSYYPFTHYDVITYRQGKWYRMTEPVGVNDASVEGAFVSKSHKPGYIKAKAVRYRDPEDPSDWEIVDSLIKIIQDVPYE